MTRTATRTAAVAVAATALITGCTAAVVDGVGRVDPSEAKSSSSSPVEPKAFPVNFSECAFDRSRLGIRGPRLAELSFDCGVVTVPLDYDDPEGDQIHISLTRVHDAHDKAPIGSLVVNPGGPGGSGIRLAVNLAGDLPESVLHSFDIVGFEPRGVDGSAPIECLTEDEKDRFYAASPNVLTEAGFAAAKSTAHRLAKRCQDKYGDELAQYGTVQTAMDLDQIRQALGDDKLTYLGFSYGTELGAQYVHRYPDNVRAAVLDGAVDPLYGSVRSTEGQLQGFEAAFDRFARWCRAHSPCSSLDDPRAAVTDLVHRAERKPLPGADGRRLTSSLLLTAVLGSLYSDLSWPGLGQALAAARFDGGRALLDLADRADGRYDGQHYTNYLEASTAISCNDVPPGPSDGVIRRTARRWTARYPLFGRFLAPSLFTCQQWQPDRTVPPLPTAPDAAHPVLVVGNLHDPATPYQGAIDLTKTLGNARLLTWNGVGHTSYLRGSRCVDGYVVAYLLRGLLPPQGSTCRR